MSASAPQRCPACGEMTSPGRFCGQCGQPLARACPSCGTENPPANRFCGECGTPLAAGVTAPGAASTTSAATSERRLVSVLFADLVGFTTLSEHRDPEEVRELLSRYFERCRTLIERYGGTVEKFIGDAVMAVWGTPVAREDDAERAVRAALSLTQAVTLLGTEVGMADLRVRAGVLTGNAAVEVGAQGEGMVLGDTVNTASRLQSIAAPGTVLVDDVTHRASEAAIAYEDAGEHPVKGREQPVHAWTALRVVAGAGGSQRGAGLEAPLVGRERELGHIIDAVEASADERRANRITVVGQAGSGKSRLLWELVKYLDGVERTVRWHQGRCLSYGEGVSYWALAEMVRSRAGITEEEGPDSARTKLHTAVETFIADERERRLVEPRLAHLLGLEQRTVSDRADLFSGWRLFFERIADTAPVMLVFEDLQWADAGLLDFIDYLLEWSADRPLFVLGLGRSELLDSRPTWSHGVITLEPLPDETMRELLEGLVPGLPGDLAARVLARADGMPLYAVETVRMLLDRGLLTQEGNSYRVTGDVGELEVPETLHALAAARLDALSAHERSVLQDASVLGQSFTAAGVAALSERDPTEVTRLLDGLVAKQVLGLNDDPLSAERGQYHFLQALLRTTAYGTLSRRDRKAHHLAAARHLQEAWGEDAPELAEVLAAHFLDAADADPEAADAHRIRSAACETLAEAGERAMSLALGAQAMRAFDRAAELAQDDLTRAKLLDRAGRAAFTDASLDQSIERLQRALELFEALGEDVLGALALVALGNTLYSADRLEDAIALERRAVEHLPAGSLELAVAQTGLAQHLAFQYADEEVLALCDAALAVLEPRQEWEAVVRCFNTIANIRDRSGRQAEAEAYREQALKLALAHDLSWEALRAHNNLANGPLQRDEFEQARTRGQQGLELANSWGNRSWRGLLGLIVATADLGLGNWDEALARAGEGSDVQAGMVRGAYRVIEARVYAGRGDRAALETTLAEVSTEVTHTNIEYQGGPLVARAIAYNALDRPAEALAAAEALALSGADVPNEDRREAFMEAGIAALALGDRSTVERLIAHVAGMPLALRSPILRAGAARFGGLLAVQDGDHGRAGHALTEAARLLRGIGARFFLGQVLLEHAEVLDATGAASDAGALRAEAIEIFTALRATPWLQRARSESRAAV